VGKSIDSLYNEERLLIILHWNLDNSYGIRVIARTLTSIVYISTPVGYILIWRGLCLLLIPWQSRATMR
jgi:hypothetical protein